MTGLLIAFEGGDGGGKSTQVQLLAETFPGTVITRQPGGTDIGKTIRGLLLDSPRGAVDNRAEALLYAADRAQHVAEVVRPALDAGKVVISDRWTDSSLAYQAAGRDQGVAWIAQLSGWATSWLVPDLTIVLDIAPGVGLARSGRRGAVDRLEAESLDFHRRVRQAYLELAGKDSDRYLVLDATRPVDELAAVIAIRVRNLIATTTGATA